MHGPSLLELISKHKQKAHPLALRALRMMSTFDDITMVLYQAITADGLFVRFVINRDGEVFLSFLRKEYTLRPGNGKVFNVMVLNDLAGILDTATTFDFLYMRGDEWHKMP
jgi:hypothetical protein